MRIMVCGDVHGGWSWLNVLMNRKRPDMILQCGDFGYYPREEKMVRNYARRMVAMRTYDPRGRIKNAPGGRLVPIHWTEGNHEDYFCLHERKSRGDFEVAPGVYWQPRGSTLKLPDGRLVLFMGGAKSTDWKLNEPGVDWFADEILTEEDLRGLPDRADIVISHTVPLEFKVPNWGGMTSEALEKQWGWDMSPDPSRPLLSRVLAHCRPSLWYAAHWHTFIQGEVGGCKWTVLNMAPNPNWWTWLPEVTAK
ncbi:metallophosphoesterase family protein [Desulfocurvibacter africanus]|uniref:metallophosphoesterase family protein n=1 Tax=Desulfocurvibacter africanus TaxID=873 RepID=UPI000480D0E7|nr:metallophosphoesterase [Desulfocurvibacter africanus]